jgi:hypothetical protein
MAKKNADIVPAAKQDLANWEQEAAAEAKAEASKISMFASKLSFKGGDIKMGDAALENPLPVIIVARCYENGYYPNKFDPDHPENPVCFALADEEKDLAPHPKSTQPQHAGPCATCPHNQSFPRACKNQIRLRVISGATAPADVAGAPVLGAQVPPTSLSGYKVYAKGIGAMGMPPWGLITELRNEKFKTWFKLSFRPIEKVTGEMWAALKAKRVSVQEEIMAPYEEREEASQAKPAAKGKKKY